MAVLWPQPGPNNTARTTPDQSDTHIPSHPCKSSHMWALAFYSAIWKFMQTGDRPCKPRTFTSAWRLSANDTYSLANVSHSVFLKLFWLLASFPPTGPLTPAGYVPLVFTLHRQGIVFHFLHKITSCVMNPRSHATSTGSLSHPHVLSGPEHTIVKSCLSLGQAHVHLYAWYVLGI